MATSRVPAAIDALLAILRASATLDGVSIVDGPPTNDLSATENIFVGYQPAAQAAATLTQEFNAAGARTRDEEFSIPCYVESRSGDTGMQARRARCFVLLGAVEDALRATDAAPTAPTLTGTVLWAELTVGNLYQSQAQGAQAGIDFTVSCRARI